MFLTRIVSGGQTGVDRAALDAALELGIPHGGWCPQGRRAENGRIPDRYQLTETPHNGYRQRTEWNIRDANATIVLAHHLPLSPGTALTMRMAGASGKPHRLYTIDTAEVGLIASWLSTHGVRVLNVAGPRESRCPGIHGRALRLLLDVCLRLKEVA